LADLLEVVQGDSISGNAVLLKIYNILLQYLGVKKLKHFYVSNFLAS